jgi:hypothetical protein
VEPLTKPLNILLNQYEEERQLRDEVHLLKTELQLLLHRRAESSPDKSSARLASKASEATHEKINFLDRTKE